MPDDFNKNLPKADINLPSGGFYLLLFIAVFLCINRVLLYQVLSTFCFK